MEKKIVYLAAAVAAAGTLACSCEKEEDLAVDSPSVGAVALVLEGVSTRSAAGEGASPLQVNSYRLESGIEGVGLSLEEVVTELGGIGSSAPGTRGTPAYTENVLDVYGRSFHGVIMGSSGQVAGDDAFSYMDEEGVWRRDLGFNPWEQSDPLKFFLRMPASPSGVTNLAYSFSGGSLSFDYATPSTASAQQDILFAMRELDEATYESERYSAKGGASVLFRHALTGVKFAIGNNTTTSGNRHPEDEVQTFITEVSVSGLKDKGHAVFSPTGTEQTPQVDDIGEHTSQNSFTWTDVAGTSRTTTYTQTYTEENIQDYASGDGVGAAPSFYTGGANRNLNDGNASLTFWFIPQEITSDLKLTVKFKIWVGQTGSMDAEERTLELDLGQRILDQASTTNKEWKAGQLRTFTLKPNEVDVDITDQVSGFTKSNVVIRNTGNVPVYLRAHIVANWYGTMQDGTDGIALGYSTASGNEFVQSWRMVGTTGDTYGGVFTGLPGSGWVQATDGFFYYTSPVDPGAVTASLFTSYSLDTSLHPVPTIWYQVIGRKQFSNVRLVMEIPVQAIEVSSGATDYVEVWAAGGVTVTLP